MSDHKTKALAYNEKAQSEYHIQNASMMMLVANFHAMMHGAELQTQAVEQQRVANLLAAAQLILDNKTQQPDGGLRGWATDSEAVIHSRMADSDFWATLLGKEAADREGL